MDELEFRKALAELQSFRQNLPGGDIEERDVVDYHRLLESVEKETNLNLRNFFIQNERLEQVVTSISPPTRANHFQRQTHYSDSRYCDHDFFLRKLDAAIIYIDGLLPKNRKDPIGF